MNLYLHNTITRNLELFKPLSANIVKMYVCGPTVYDDIHIGNARTFVVFDLLYRILNVFYDEVVYIRNITDIDDKIENKAKDIKQEPCFVSEKYIKSFSENMDYLNCCKPSFEPKVTNFIEKIIEFISKLIEKDLAYIAQDGVYFRVGRYEDYYKLSNRSKDFEVSGTRILPSDKKDSKEDFVLWKLGKDYSWNSPWGPGRPGWHTECCVMGYEYLSEKFDIHGGGIDLLFPHHTNELAQMEMGYGSQINYWIHSESLLVKNQKMSKSLGNFISVNEIRSKNISQGALRLFFFSASYRKPLDFTYEKLEVFIKKYEQLSKFLTENKSQLKSDLSSRSISSAKTAGKTILENNCQDEFIKSLANDMNTAVALRILYETFAEAKKEIKTSIDSAKTSGEMTALYRLYLYGKVIGIFNELD